MLTFYETINIDTRTFATEDPRGFLAGLPDGAILDEIQNAPELSSYIQTLVDQDQRNGLFILTGNQQFEVATAINQSLAERTALLQEVSILIFVFCQGLALIPFVNQYINTRSQKLR